MGLENAARAICERLVAAGHRAVWAGGCVRDLLLGRPFHDIDIATSARPEQVTALFAHTRQVGRIFGVVLVEHAGHWFEVATFREDLEYHDGRRPVGVRYADEIADARRRDFTINGLFYDPLTQEVRDYVGGQADLTAQLVRAIGDPRQRFAEDRLRLLRAVRFAATLGFEIEPITRAAICEMAGAIVEVAAERLREELTRLWLEAKRPGSALRLLEQLGLLAALLPEVAAMRGVPHAPDRHDAEDVLEHTAEMLDRMERRTAELAWAIVFHDVGRSAVRNHKARRSRLRPETIAAEVAATVLTRLRSSKRLRETVTACVRSLPRYSTIPHMRLAQLRRWMADPVFEIGLELHRLDVGVCGVECGACRRVADVRHILAVEAAMPAPLLRGDDLLALGVRPGREVGRWLRRAMNRQLETPGMTREMLLEWLHKEVRRDASARRPMGDGGPPAADMRGFSAARPSRTARRRAE